MADTAARATLPLDDLDAMIGCPKCDALHRVRHVDDNAQARCVRCGTVIIAPRSNAFSRITGLAATSLILMVAALFFPFLDLSVSGLHNRASVFDAAMAFSSGVMVILSLGVAAVIILIPILRLAALIYALWPLMHGARPYRHARSAFRLAEGLKPWSMAEIFILGVTVALVKVAGLATVTPGPAFWAFAGLVVVTVLQDTFMCKYSIWKALDRNPTS